MPSRKKLNKYSVVPISVKTGKVVKSPRKGQKIKYAVRGPRGGLKVLRAEPQEFYKTDLKGLNKIVSETGTGNFVVYEQKLRYPEKDKKGKPLYRVDAAGNKKKIYQTKITFAKPKSKTKPLLFKGGKKLRALDLAFKEGNYESKKRLRELTIIKPNTKIRKQILKGATIKQALSNIQLDIDMKKVRKQGFGVYYNIFVRIEAPGGEVIKVPVSAEFIDNEYSGVNYIPVDGEPERFGRSKIKILANLQSRMAQSIRYALKNTGQGYTFTNLATLEQIEKRVINQVKKAERSGEDAKADRLINSLKALYFGNKKKNFVNPETKLIPLKPKYKVTMYVKFEVMDE